MSKAVQQYLANYAEPEALQVSDMPSLGDVKHCLAIPSYDEPIDFVERIRNAKFSNPDIKRSAKTLIIVVVNQPEGATSALNTEMLRTFADWKLLWQQDHLSLRNSANDSQYWLIVDKTSPGIGKTEGVGTARKIAADIACALWYSGCIKQQWLHCSDADAHLPDNYFLPLDAKNAATTFAYTHRPNLAFPDVGLATQWYEKSLNYYVDGLAWAGSPYAFPTIGSTMAINLKFYAMARGFPKRNGAEDFYLLNKLAKLAPVTRMHEVKVEIDSRISHRVPFGTGPAVEKLLQTNDFANQFVYYDPRCFADLKAWLELFPLLAQHPSQAQQWVERLSPAAQFAAQEMNYPKLIAHIVKQKLPPQQAINALHTAFDGFKTLKWIRCLQDHAYPARPLVQLLEEAPFSHAI